MKRVACDVLGFFLVVLAPVLVFGQGETAYKYILDYSVPESPAFTALGVTPSKVWSGSASKPIAASLLNQIQTGQKVDKGIAIDFSPYFNLLGGKLKNIQEYRTNKIKRWLANLQTSIATVENNADTSSLLFGLGGRLTLVDDHDILADTSLGKAIDRALMAKAKAPTTIGGEDVIERKTVDLSEAYAETKENLRAKLGNAVALGWGMASRLRHSVANFDSLDQTRHRVWISYVRYSFLKGVDLLATFHGRYAKFAHPDHRVGIALRPTSSKINFATELVYIFSTRQWELGALGEISVLPNIGVVLSLSAERQSNLEKAPTIVKMRTLLRWNVGQ